MISVHSPSSRRSLWAWHALICQACCICRLIQIGCLVAYYVLAAVAVSQQNGSVIRSRNAPWPSWAWAFLAGAGLVWVVVSILMLGMQPELLISYTPFHIYLILKRSCWLASIADRRCRCRTAVTMPDGASMYTSTRSCSPVQGAVFAQQQQRARLSC